MSTRHRLEPLRADAPVGTRVLIVEPYLGYVVDYTRTVPRLDPLYGWVVFVGNRILTKLKYCYEVPNQALEQLT